MNSIKEIKEQLGYEEIGLDDTFVFHCTQCGSPIAPGSFVLSRTVICFTDSGIASISASAQNGLYRRTFTTPTFSPAAIR